MEIVNHSFQEIKESFDKKRTFFDLGHTKSYEFRRNALINLRNAIIKYKSEILDALYADFKKPSYEAYIGEIGVTTDDINFALKHLAQWMEVQHVPTPLTIQPASSKIYSDPKGVVLIFAPWNYPFNLTFSILPFQSYIFRSCLFYLINSLVIRYHRSSTIQMRDSGFVSFFNILPILIVFFLNRIILHTQTC